MLVFLTSLPKHCSCIESHFFMSILGMDPIAKRFMWDVISRLSTRQGKTAVILTTHSMNEAQALCTRIGVMVLFLKVTLDPASIS